jgi:hypothetical protein
MPSIAILHEAQQLHDVSDRLDALAGQHSLFSEALIGISGSVRNTALCWRYWSRPKWRPCWDSIQQTPEMLSTVL